MREGAQAFFFTGGRRGAHHEAGAAEVAVGHRTAVRVEGGHLE